MSPAAPRCSCCGRERKRRADNRGWTGYRKLCGACAERWRIAGKPAEGPPVASSGPEKAARISAGLSRHHAAYGQSEAALGALAAGRVAGRRAGPLIAAQKAADRLTDYAWLWSFGEPRESAAARARVSVRRARYVYEPKIAAMEASPAGGAEGREAA